MSLRLLWTRMGRVQAPTIENRTAKTQGKVGRASEGDAGLPLKRCLSFPMVVLFGIANTVGTGIFVSPGKAAVGAGPGLFMSFLLAGFGCCLSGLCYADFAARVSSSGGAYTYVYSTLGEFTAFLTGISLTMEYGVSSSAISRGWSAFFRELLEKYVGVQVPWWLHEVDVFPGSAVGNVLKIDLLAPLLCLAVAALCLAGVRESQRVSAAITIMNVSVILLIVICGLTSFGVENFTPLTPNGAAGVLKASSSVFFSFIGWDAMCVLSEEVKDPLRVIPRAIVTTLVIVTFLYTAMAISLMGMVDHEWITSLSEDALKTALVRAFNSVEMSWVGVAISIIGCSCAMNATYGTTQGQPRVWYRMAKDGLLPAKFVSVNAKQVPSFAIIATGSMTITLAAFLDFHALSDVIAGSCLFMQALVCFGCFSYRASLSSSRLGTPALFAFSLAAVGLGLASQSASACGLGCAAVVFGLASLALTAVAFGTSECGWVATALNIAAPLLGAVVNLVVMGSQGPMAVATLAGFFAVCSLFYFCYSQRQSILNGDDDDMH